jgi:hypothetical protein
MADSVRTVDEVVRLGKDYPVQRALVSVAASQTDSALVAAQGAGLKIYVLGFRFQAAATPSTAVFTTKPGGAGTAISPVYSPTASLFYGIDFSHVTLFNTNANEGLSLTTGAGGTTVGEVWYIVAP